MGYIMSKDVHIAHICPHHIRFERTTAVGGIEVPTLSPVSSAGLLMLRRDGVSLPPNGLFKNASVFFPKKAPYRVKEGQNILSVNGVSYTIPSKIYTLKEIVAWLNVNLDGYITSAYEGTIKIEHPTERSVSVSGSALSHAFGVRLGRFIGHRKNLTPSWRLSRNSLSGVSIIFEKELDPVGLLDISYLTEKQYCRRCGSTGVENDFRLDSFGEMTMIRDHDLLYQIVAKALLTEVGSNPFHSWYGSTAMSLIGQKVNSAVVQGLKDSVLKCLSNMIDIQSSQAQVQTVSLKERISRVLSVEVEQIGDDVTSLLCTVVVQSASSEPVSVNIVFAVPNSIPLDGDLA